MHLRKFQVADAARIAELVGNYEVSKWTSSIPHPYSTEDATAWVHSAESDTVRHPYAVEANNELVACVSYWPDETGGIEIGYWVGQEYWGKGIATQALQMLLAADFFPDDERIVARIMEGNTGSQRVLEKCGFKLVESCTILCRGKTIPSKLFIRQAQ
ncbi:MAG: GNAT family N-acetyltransferase [Halieaceae bacterium]